MVSSLSSSRWNNLPPQFSQRSLGLISTLVIWPHSAQTRRAVRRLTIASSSTAISIAFRSISPIRFRIPSSPCAWGMVRGNPSRINPFRQSRSCRRFSTIFRINSSDTSSPASKTALTWRPSGDAFLTSARRMSPVDICGTRYCTIINLACVPLPAPGVPKRITCIVGLLR